MTDNRTLEPVAASLADLQQRDAYREQLSAMMDGMLSTDESRFLLRRMQHDAELAGYWERWQLFGDAMRGQTGTALPADFSRRVSRAIAAEAEANRAAQLAASQSDSAQEVGTAWRQRLRWGGGAALAASVAIAALISTRSLTTDPNTLPQAAVAQSTTMPAASVATASAVSHATAPASESVVLSPDQLPKQVASIALVSTDSSAPSAGDAIQNTAAVAVVSAAAASPRARRDARAGARFSGRRESRPTALATASNEPARAIADPFGTQTLDLSAKPWPRALLSESAAVGGVTVDYSVGGPGVHPSFQPRVDAAPAPQSSDGAASTGETPTP